MGNNVLLIDDDPVTGFILKNVIKQHSGYDVITLNSSSELPDQVLTLMEKESIKLVVLSMSLNEINALGVLKYIKGNFPDIDIIVSSSVKDLDRVNEAIKLGAVDYIRKDDKTERIAQSLASVLKSSPKKASDDKPDAKEVDKGGFSSIIGAKSLSDVIETAKKAAETDMPILITGESGVGKEIFANAIQDSSKRADKPMIVVNCGAIPENLVESILFGHEKGAFTGAIAKSIGKFREADGGTIFLDEIGELPLDLQVKLLRVLQENEVDPVGASKPEKIDVRIISATNIDLKNAVDRGDFREDLYYRLNVFPLAIPALRERSKSDIAELANFFCRKISNKEGKKISDIDEAAIDLIAQYEWPGNVRQLENAIARAVVLCTGKTLGLSDFTQISNTLLKSQHDDAKAEMHEQLISSSQAGQLQALSGHVIDLMSATGNFREIKDVEGEMISKAVDFYRWRITDVAKNLGVCRSTLYRKMDQIGLKDPRHGN